jgi:hypothetical protein
MKAAENHPGHDKHTTTMIRMSAPTRHSDLIGPVVPGSGTTTRRMPAKKEDRISEGAESTGGPAGHIGRFFP